MESNTGESSTNKVRRWAGLFWVLVEVNIAGGTIFGFPALFEVLPQYGIFDHYCKPDSATNSTKLDCSGQTTQYQVK